MTRHPLPATAKSAAKYRAGRPPTPGSRRQRTLELLEHHNAPLRSDLIAEMIGEPDKIEGVGQALKDLGNEGVIYKHGTELGPNGKHYGVWGASPNGKPSLIADLIEPLLPAARPRPNNLGKTWQVLFGFSVPDQAPETARRAVRLLSAGRAHRNGDSQFDTPAERREAFVQYLVDNGPTPVVELAHFFNSDVQTARNDLVVLKLAGQARQAGRERQGGTRSMLWEAVE